MVLEFFLYGWKLEPGRRRWKKYQKPEPAKNRPAPQHWFWCKNKSFQNVGRSTVLYTLTHYIDCHLTLQTIAGKKKFSLLQLDSILYDRVKGF